MPSGFGRVVWHATSGTRRQAESHLCSSYAYLLSARNNSLYPKTKGLQAILLGNMGG